MPRIVAEKIDWIKSGFELFAAQGEAGIVVEKMAAKLKCNRSSFYWHFHSKKEFIGEIIKHWVHVDTNQIITLTQRSATARQQFEKLVEVVFRKDPHVDFVFHIKRYALKDKTIQKIIDDVDELRIGYVSELLRKLNVPHEDAEIQSRLFYKYLIGYHEMIRYKPQKGNYTDEVWKELSQFISI